jgi:hypothetical protein
MRWESRRWLWALILVALLPSSAHAQGKVHDPSSDGAIIGAVIGAGAGLGLVAIAYANCTGGCEAPEPAGQYAMGAAYGAGIGALAGWLVDRLHKGNERVVPVVSPVLTSRHKGIALSLKF